MTLPMHAHWQLRVALQSKTFKLLKSHPAFVPAFEHFEHFEQTYLGADRPHLSRIKEGRIEQPGNQTSEFGE
jgi:hypothetical protein